MNPIKKVRSKIRRDTKEWDALRTSLIATLPPMPTPEIVKKATAHLLSLSFGLAMYYDLKKTAPQLWKSPSSLEEKNFVKVVFNWSAEDASLFNSFQKMVGMSRNKSWILLLRSFALAAARNQINLTEIVPTAKRLTNAELVVMTKILAGLNLDGM